jgi:hypothetical protein
MERRWRGIVRRWQDQRAGESNGRDRTRTRIRDTKRDVEREGSERREKCVLKREVEEVM